MAKRKKRNPFTRLCVIIALFFLMWVGYMMASALGAVIALFTGFILAMAVWEVVHTLKAKK